MSAMTSDRPNVPVPDQLAGIREQIRALETNERELKEALIANPDIRMGANWLAEVKEIETSRVDLKELRAMHKDLVEEYTFPTKVTRVELSAVDAHTGEIISARQFRNKEKAT
jgi:predicted phage-related endonuclease